MATFVNLAISWYSGTGDPKTEREYENQDLKIKFTNHFLKLITA